MPKSKTPPPPPIPGFETLVIASSTMDELMRQIDALPKPGDEFMDKLGEKPKRVVPLPPLEDVGKIQDEKLKQAQAVIGQPNADLPPGNPEPQKPRGPNLVDKRQMEIERWIRKQKEAGEPEAKIARMVQRNEHIFTTPPGTMINADTGKPATPDEVAAFEQARNPQGAPQETPKPAGAGPIAPADARRDARTGLTNIDDWRRLTVQTPQNFDAINKPAPIQRPDGVNLVGQRVHGQGWDRQAVPDGGFEPDDVLAARRADLMRRIHLPGQETPGAIYDVTGDYSFNPQNPELPESMATVPPNSNFMVSDKGYGWATNLSQPKLPTANGTAQQRKNPNMPDLSLLPDPFKS